MNRKNSFYSIYSKIIELNNSIMQLDIEWENTKIQYYALQDENAKQINIDKRKRLKFYILNNYEVLLKLFMSLETNELKEYSHHMDAIKDTLEDEDMWELVKQTNSYPLFRLLKDSGYNLEVTKKM